MKALGNKKNSARWHWKTDRLYEIQEYVDIIRISLQIDFHHHFSAIEQSCVSPTDVSRRSIKQFVTFREKNHALRRSLLSDDVVNIHLDPNAEFPAPPNLSPAGHVYLDRVKDRKSSVRNLQKIVQDIREQYGKDEGLTDISTEVNFPDGKVDKWVPKN